jgi:hypothetical protein
MTDNNNIPSQKLIEEWMSLTSGTVHYTKVCDEQYGREYWPQLRMIFKRMKDKGIVEPVVGRDGWYQWLETKSEPINWQDLKDSEDSGLLLPFDLRKYVFIYPDTTTIVAGAKSSGKTGFIYRTVALNMMNPAFDNIELLTNLEGGIQLLRDRFTNMDIKIPKPAPFNVRNVNEKFYNYIDKPRTLYCIDYIDAPEGTDFYLIAAHIKKIDQRLQGLRSVAVIGLQKPSTRDIAFGGEQTLKNASLYIALDSHRLKIVDAKVPADKKLYPRNMMFSFDYENDGTNFINIKRSYNSDSDV